MFGEEEFKTFIEKGEDERFGDMEEGRGDPQNDEGIGEKERKEEGDIEVTGESAE